MTKLVNWLPNERVDVPDISYGTNGIAAGILQQGFNQFFQDNFARIATGFRVEVTLPATVTVYNGVAFDRSGIIVTTEGDEGASRSLTFGADGQYFLEVALALFESDVDARGFWNPTYDNGVDPSGDARLPGREFAQNVASRINPDWFIISPVSTTGFQLTTNPNSTRIPIATVQVAAGVITAFSPLVVARTVLENAAGIGVTSVRVLDSRIFPDTFTATIGGEAVTVNVNDRVNGVLTLAAALTIAHVPGDRVIRTGAAAALIPERATPPLPTTGSLDARPRYFQANEERGYALAQDPYSATGRSDLTVQVLKDEIDLLAAQLREMRFGSERASDVGLLPPPTAFTTAPRYFDRSGGIQGARSANVSIGDGLLTFGDLNTNAFSNNLGAALTAAFAALPAAGGSIYIKRGVYTISTAVSMTGKPLVIFGDGGHLITGGTTIQIATAGSLSMSGAGISISNLNVIRVAASTGTNSLKIVNTVQLYMESCRIEGMELTFPANGGAVTNCIFTGYDGPGGNSIAFLGDPSGVVFTGCQFTCGSVVASRALKILGSNANTINFMSCVFSAGIGSVSVATVEIASAGVCKGITFTGSKFVGGGATTVAVQATSGGAVSEIAFYNCSSDHPAGFIVISNVVGLHIRDCLINFTPPATTAISIGIGTNTHITISGCQILAPIVAPGGTAAFGMFFNGADNVKITDGVITNCPVGIQLKTVGNFVVSGIEISHTGTTTGRQGIVLSNSTNVGEIVNCKIERLQDATDGIINAIRINAGCSYVNIANNMIHNIGALVPVVGGTHVYGIRLGTSGSGSSESRIGIVNNSFESITTSGGRAKAVIAEDGLADTRIVGNSFIAIGTGAGGNVPGFGFASVLDLGVAFPTAAKANIVISGNEVASVGLASSTSGAGIFVGFNGPSGQVVDIVVTSNTVTSISYLSGGSGVIAVLSSRRVVVANNTITGIATTRQTGIQITTTGFGEGGITVSGNVIGDTDTSLVATGILVVYTAASQGRLAITGNTIAGFSSAGISVNGVIGSPGSVEAISISGNSMQTSVFGGTGIIAQDVRCCSITGNSMNLYGVGGFRWGMEVGTGFSSSLETVICGNAIRINQATNAIGIQVGGSESAISGNHIMISGGGGSATGINTVGGSRMFISSNTIQSLGGAITTITLGPTDCNSRGLSNVNTNTNGAGGIFPTGVADVGLNLRKGA